MQIGVDIGSTTIKLVAVEDKIVHKEYWRHRSEIDSALKRVFNVISEIVGEQKFKIALTGSAGLGAAKKFALPFVQEVIACRDAVCKFLPKAETIIELGGEDAKIIYLRGAAEVRMNGVCAGGTGSFIDHMAALLNTTAEGLNELAMRGERIYSIASRCGVFAKTDVQSLMNDGVSKADIALSIMQAVVNQTIGNLAQGRPIEGVVALLGGPLHFLTALRQRFIETLKLSPEQTAETEVGNYFVAMGAAMSDDAKVIDVEDLNRPAQIESVSNPTMSPLFADAVEIAEFKNRHAVHKVKRGSLKNYRGKVYIGIDAGSTTTKICVISEEREVLYTAYRNNGGTPLASVIEELKKLYTILPEGVEIARVYTTGYGEHIVKAALHADGSEVETFAHLTAAQHFCNDVSFVLDIGGQDMKAFVVKDGTIGNITLNEACSAGCGSFIQNFAQGLNLPVAEFAKLALDAKNPVDLGTRCTVFMNSKVKQAHKDGASVADISAGIALSVIKNALFKVMQLKNVDDLGDKIVVQGGTFCNDAILRAFEMITGKEVIRPDIAGLMGAYGAAILALESDTGEKTAMLTSEQLNNFDVVTKSYRCGRCGNNCLITMQKFPDGGKYFTGNRCERGVGGKPSAASNTPNGYAYKYNRLFDYESLPAQNAKRGKIGIPRVLNMYEEYPFWFTFFTELGYSVELSGDSNAKLFNKGISTIPSDSLCYPAKLAHGHIMDLVERGVGKIFYPCEPYNFDTESDNFYNCPIVASYPENIRGNMDILRERHIQFIQPFLPVHDIAKLKKRLAEEFKAEGISSKEIFAAVDKAATELEHYRRDVRKFGEDLLTRIEQTGEHAILLVGRPYHADPEINHGISEMIQSYKLPIITEDMVYHLPIKSSAISVVNQWSYHARLYHAAHFAAEHPNITLIQLSSFGCGLDALTTEQVKEILESHERIYTMIKLDEVSNLGAARIRLRSLLAALSRRKVLPYREIEFKPRPRFTLECKKTHTILAPQMAPIHFDLIQAVLRKYGYRLEIPALPDKNAIDLGLRYVNNDMCYPAIVVIGQLIGALKSAECDPDNTSIVLFQTCGACRATNYISVLRRALKYAGFSQVPVFACYGLPDETDEFELSNDCLMDAIKASIYGDLLMNVSNRMRPYEIHSGETDRLFENWMTVAKGDLVNGNYLTFRKNVREIVRQFDSIEIDEMLEKPKVGIVGEILVKYHPVANNRIEKILQAEGAEIVMPDFVDFFLYSAYDAVARQKVLLGSRKERFFGELFIKFIEFFRRPMKNALQESEHFRAPYSIKETARLASRYVSVGNMAGEGWFLTGEMVKLLEEGVNNIVCLQPFGCLPNHITGKGVMHSLRTSCENANIVAIDCDAGSSEVNQLNRLKLMLAVAKQDLAKNSAVAT